MSRVNQVESQTQSQVESEPPLVTQVVPDQGHPGSSQPDQVESNPSPIIVLGSDQVGQPKANRRNAWKLDKKEYNDWMSKRSYYRRMIKKYSELVHGSDQAKVGLAKVKLSEYQERLKQSEIEIVKARELYGIGKRDRQKSISSTTNNGSSSGDELDTSDFA